MLRNNGGQCQWNLLGAKVYVVGELVDDRGVVPGRRAHRAEEQQEGQSAAGPAPESQDEQGRHGKQLRVDAQVVGVRQAHLAEAEVVVDEEQVAPPVLLADVGVVAHHQVPLRPAAPQRQDEGAEQDEGGQRWDDPHQPADVLVLQPDGLLLHQAAEQGVGREHATEQQEGIRVERGRPSNHRPRLAQALGHGRPVVVRVEEHGHRLVREDQHHGVEEADAMHRLNVPGSTAGAEKPAQVLVQREGREPGVCFGTETGFIFQLTAWRIWATHSAWAATWWSGRRWWRALRRREPAGRTAPPRWCSDPRDADHALGTSEAPLAH